MHVKMAVAVLVGFVVQLWQPAPRRDERGLSQSTEIAILVGSVALLAAAIIVVVRPYVMSKLPR